VRELFHRERQEADIIAAPTRMLDRRALAAASGARAQRRSLSLEVFGPPTDHGNSARQRRAVLAVLAPYPYPRRRALQVAERGPRLLDRDQPPRHPRTSPPRWLPAGDPRGDPLHPGPGGGAGRRRGLRDVCLAAWLRSGHGRGRLRCHQVTGDETKSRSNTMLLTMTGAAPQPIGLGETTQAC
jgi:hypothetical protein